MQEGCTWGLISPFCRNVFWKEKKFKRSFRNVYEKEDELKAECKRVEETNS
jgi:hypothetical protein